MSQKKPQPLVYSVWATAWGPVGAVAGERGLCRFVLPHYPLRDLEQLLAWEHKAAVRDDAPFAELVPLTRDYFNGQVVDFTSVACDMPPEGSFSGLVLRACRQIPYGQTLGYLGLAKQIGRDDAARAVATALSKNNIPLIIPCHRVIYSGGGMGGFTAEGGTQLKRRMIEMEKKNRPPAKEDKS